MAFQKKLHFKGKMLSDIALKAKVVVLNNATNLFQTD